LTPEQEAHLFRIKAAFLKEVDTKYRSGQREHGGDLFDHTALWLCQQLMQEGVDMYVYGFTLLERLTGMALDVKAATQTEGCNCHCGKVYEVVWDDGLPGGRTYREIR
jgi:hypothetical protein